MLGNLGADETDAFGELVHTVHSVLDADPAVEAHRSKFGKDRIVIVEPSANGAVTKPLGVARRSTFFSPQILECAFGEIAVGRVHRDDAVLDAAQQLQRTVAREKGVGRIVVHAEAWMLDAS